MNNENITIIVASDNHYAILIVALLKSIDVNHKTDEHIDFYIIDDGIVKSFREKLESTVDPKRFTIRWVLSKDIIPSHIKIPVDKSAFPLTSYMRIFSPYVINKSAIKLIYLDVDTLVQDDISKLWNLSLGNYTMAAAQDTGKTVDCKWAGIANYAELGLAPDTKYFNSGVLLINPKKWREEEITDKVIDALTVHKKFVQLADQYGLNVVMANKWLQLDPRWNWFAVNEHDSPSIIHFLDIKPIFSTYNSVEAFKVEFFRYLSMTPWKNFKPINGNKRYLRKIFIKLKKTFLKR